MMEISRLMDRHPDIVMEMFPRKVKKSSFNI